jgi:two-component system OmpR family sensor kinase
MTIRSIRFQIVFWHIIVLSLTFIVFGAVLYHTVSKRLNSDLNDLLLTRADGIRDAIDSIWEEERRDALEAGLTTENMSKGHNVNFAKIVKRWVAENNLDLLLANIDVGIFDADGQIISSSVRASSSASMPQFLPGREVMPPGKFEDRLAVLSPKNKIQERTLTVPAEENNRPVYFIRVISPLTSLRTFLRHLKIMLLFLFPFVIVSSGLAGIFLAKVVLTPVDRMIETIHRISAENLRLRVKVPNTDDELQSLAETFNGMLDHLEQSFSSQRHFIEDLTHELKTPLSVLKGELEVTLKKLRSAQDYEAILHSSLDEVNRIIKISENLLLLARFDSDTMSIEKSPLDLAELVTEILTEMKVLSQQKEVRLLLTGREAAVVSGDVAKLRQLFVNVLDNAIKYTPSKGTVTVSVSRAPAYAIVNIADTGKGIPEDILPRIFDRFFRGERDSGQAGFGLGLPIAMAIAKAHRGKIEVQSTPDRGSTFTIWLPLSGPRANPSP